MSTRVLINRVASAPCRKRGSNAGMLFIIGPASRTPSLTRGLSLIPDPNEFFGITQRKWFVQIAFNKFDSVILSIFRNTPETGMKFSPLALKLVVLAATMMIATAVSAKPSNKWRLEFSGKADSDGIIVIVLTPVDGEPIRTETAIENDTGENAVAKAVVKSLKAQLSKDQFKVERDDGEDVLIKKRRKNPDFDVEIVEQTVEGVRIHPQHE